MSAGETAGTERAVIARLRAENAWLIDTVLRLEQRVDWAQATIKAICERAGVSFDSQPQEQSADGSGVPEAAGAITDQVSVAKRRAAMYAIRGGAR